jgi:amidohydrolase
MPRMTTSTPSVSAVAGAASSPKPAAAKNALLARAREILPEIIEIRRAIHRQPELGLQLPKTQARIVDELRALGLEPRTGTSTTSVTAVIGADRPGRTVILRGDMDALPLTEETGLDFASEVDGAMHACGHDTHVATLLGGARLLVERLRDDPEGLPGPVLLDFQPGEEGWFGARFMIEEGLLDGAAGTKPLGPDSARAFALHISSQYPTGQIHLKGGPIQASGDNVHIDVRGSGGHASAPHHARDPIPAAAEMILSLEVAVTRSVDAFDPAVLTIAHLRSGTTTNIIPETAHLSGTYRTVSAERRAAMRPLIERVVQGIATAHGLTAEARFEEGYPVTVNDPAVAARVFEIVDDLLGKGAAVEMPAPIMGAEDWSYVLQRVPGVMVYLGARPPEHPLEGYPQNHSNLVVFDEDSLAIGAALYAAAALEL